MEPDDPLHPVPPTRVRDMSELEALVLQMERRVTHDLVLRETRRHRGWALIATALTAFGAFGVFAGIQYVVNEIVGERMLEERQSMLTQLHTANERQEDKLALMEGQLNVIKDEVNSKVTTEVQQLFDDRYASLIEERINKVSQKLESQQRYQQLATLSMSLELKDSFSKSERDQAMQLLRTVANDSEVRQNEGFGIIFRRFVESFAAAGLKQQMLELFELYKKEILDSNSISQSYGTSIGRQLLHAKLGALPGEENLLAIFEDVFVNSYNKDYVETVLPFRVVYMHVKGESPDRIKTLLREMLTLDPAQEMGFCVRMLWTYRKSEWYQRRADEESVSVVKGFNSFFDEYGSYVRGLILSNESKKSAVERELINSKEDDLKLLALAWLAGSNPNGLTDMEVLKSLLKESNPKPEKLEG